MLRHNELKSTSSSSSSSKSPETELKPGTSVAPTTTPAKSASKIFCTFRFTQQTELVGPPLSTEVAASLSPIEKKLADEFRRMGSFDTTVKISATFFSTPSSSRMCEVLFMADNENCPSYRDKLKVFRGSYIVANAVHYDNLLHKTKMHDVIYVSLWDLEKKSLAHLFNSEELARIKSILVTPPEEKKDPVPRF